MKKLVLLISAASFIISSCHDSKENATQKLPKFYAKTVGEQIPLDVANRWVNNFGGTVTAGRAQSEYSLSSGALAELVGSNDGLGVVLHHAIDENSEHHILMFALGADGELFQSEILDLSTRLILPAATARAWAKTYADEHPATPWYHFFGRDIFSEIQSNAAFEYVNVVRALNEENEEQLLLFVYNTANASGGRAQGEDVTVYDVSSPCPPCSIN